MGMSQQQPLIRIPSFERRSALSAAKRPSCSVLRAAHPFAAITTLKAFLALGVITSPPRSATTAVADSLGLNARLLALLS